MIIFFQAIFIAIIILHQQNIWVTLIPYPTTTFSIIGISLFFLGLIRCNLLLRKPPLQAFIALVVLLVFQLLARQGGSEELSTSFKSVLGYAMLTILCVSIISQWRQEQERFAMKLYVVMSSMIAFFGFVAWLIVNLTWMYDGTIDSVHLINLEQFSGGKMTRISGDVEHVSQFGIGENTYSFPYSLGLVLTGSYMYELAGIQFFRASGVFHEPVSTWFMTIPAMVLIISDSLFSKSVRRVLMTVQMLFLISAFSLSIILGLTLIFILRQILHPFSPSSSSASGLKAVMLVAMFGVGFGFIYYLSKNYSIDYLEGANVILSKLSTNSYMSIVLVSLFNSLNSFLAYIYFFGVAIRCLWNAVKVQDNTLMAFSLIIIAFLIVTMKGALMHILISPGFYILFFLMLRHHKKIVSVFPQPAVQ